MVGYFDVKRWVGKKFLYLGGEMLYGLKGTHPIEGELYQEFTSREVETCLAIAELWRAKGWKPRLVERRWDGCSNSALTQHIGQRKAA